MKQRYNKKKNKIKINYFFFIYYENVSNIYYPQIIQNFMHNYKQFKSLREYGINIIYKYIFKYFNKIYHFIKVLNIEMTKFYLCIFKMK
ncbi:hypothetical protein PFAG_02635 [Plasmodium falciparum Santa Lucia]|uniref:Uncharacterized protein n=1 Tax=Plasmodium falciparum Santa Lucia TaxID=478859 RepID=W7G6G6_PLAFA|nr:hypothetical protein PFAG_02635 [Plasmodium falciparum Santa Lucia]